MPRALDPRISEILTRYGENPRDDKGVIWDCHGTWVVYHRALERVAAKAGVSFSKPDVLRSERDEAVILCSGKLGDREDWEIGEALIGVNYKVSGKQAAYVYAMALKRARDRLILKLIGLHGLLYSEEESDDFRQQGGTGRQSDRHINEDDTQEDGPDYGLEFIAECEGKIAAFRDPMALRTWWASSEFREHCEEFKLTGEEVAGLKAKMTARLSLLAPKTAP
jgi:hypothetical protein